MSIFFSVCKMRMDRYAIKYPGQGGFVFEIKFEIS